MQISICTYNIHACIGTDGHLDPQRTVAVLKEIDADVVALQEVEHFQFQNLDLLAYLTTETGLTAIAGPTLLRQTRHYGNALLTRLPIHKLQRINLSIKGREPRGALDVSLDCGGQDLQVIATHLGLTPGERRQQVRQLLTRFEAQNSGIEVLMGDLNEWFLWGRVRRWLRAHFQATPSLATYPARWPMLALDHIWVSPRNALSKLAVHRSRLARRASDHLPLTACIDI